MPHSTCPYCGVAVIGDLADHIAFTNECAWGQIAQSTGMDAAQPLSEETP